jgi:predicted PurR-regulated permease PerM
MAIAAFLPLVGIAAVVLPATVYLWIGGRPLAAVIFLVFCMGQSFFFEYGLKPRMMGSSMRMNNLLVFLSLLGGIVGFGAPGLIYGPLIMTLFLTLVQLYQTRYQQHIARRLATMAPANPEKPKT